MSTPIKPKGKGPNTNFSFYRFRQATHDFGRRAKNVRAIVFHMAEGINADSYLSGGNILRKVSAHFVIRGNGEVIQMLDLRNISGSLNPRDVRGTTDKNGHYGAKFTRFMGSLIHQGFVNHMTWSVEMDGKANASWTYGGRRYAAGPNAAQTASAIELVKNLRQFAGSAKVGVCGHRDFADYKWCPGHQDGMRAILAAVGHGQERTETPIPDPDPEPIPSDLAKALARIAVLETQLEDKEEELQKVKATAEDLLDAMAVDAVALDKIAKGIIARLPSNG